MNTQIISNEARKAVVFGLQNHWFFRVVGDVVGGGKIPQKPTHSNGWWFEPYTTQHIPQEGLERLEALRRAGVQIQGVIVAHEAPKLLTGEKVQKKPDFKITPSTSILTTLGSIAMFAMLLIAEFFTAILIDPALIVVLEDGTWLEVMTWYEE